MKTTDFANYISDFLSKYLPFEKGCSHNTIIAYRDTFVLLITYIENEEKISINKLKLNDLTKEVILSFLEWLEKVRNCGSSTRNMRLSAIKSFFKYLRLQNIQYLNEIQSILSISKKRAHVSAPSFLSLEEIKQILNAPNINTSRGVRDLSLLSLLYDTGARVQEIIDLTPSMINFNKPYTIKFIGKGNKSRIVPMVNGQTDHLKRYLSLFRLDSPEKRLNPLFFNSKNEKLTRSGITYILNKYVKKVRELDNEVLNKKISCHTLRHSKAMHLMQAGVNLVYIRDILGHKSIQTTEIYARIDSKHKRIALEQAYVEIVSNEKPQWEENINLKSWLKKF